MHSISNVNWFLLTCLLTLGSEKLHHPCHLAKTLQETREIICTLYAKEMSLTSITPCNSDDYLADDDHSQDTEPYVDEVNQTQAMSEKLMHELYEHMQQCLLASLKINQNNPKFCQILNILSRNLECNYDCCNIEIQLPQLAPEKLEMISEHLNIILRHLSEVYSTSTTMQSSETVYFKNQNYLLRQQLACKIIINQLQIQLQNYKYDCLIEMQTDHDQNQFIQLIQEVEQGLSNYYRTYNFNLQINKRKTDDLTSICRYLQDQLLALSEQLPIEHLMGHTCSKISETIEREFTRLIAHEINH